MDQPGQDEPAGMSVGADRLGGLHQVLDLGQVGIGVAVVDQRVEELHRLPDPHLPLVLRQVLPLLGPDEVERLMSMIQPVELADARADIRPVIAERRLLIGLRIPFLQERFPLVQVSQRVGLRRSRILRSTCSGSFLSSADRANEPAELPQRNDDAPSLSNIRQNGIRRKTIAYRVLVCQAVPMSAIDVAPDAAGSSHPGSCAGPWVSWNVPCVSTTWCTVGVVGTS